MVLINGATRAVKLKEPELCILNILKWFYLVFLVLCVEKTRVWPGSVCFGVFKSLSTRLALLSRRGGEFGLVSLISFDGSRR